MSCLSADGRLCDTRWIPSTTGPVDTHRLLSMCIPTGREHSRRGKVVMPNNRNMMILEENKFMQITFSVESPSFHTDFI